MLSRVIAITSLLLAMLLSGCATQTKMALSNDTDAVSNTGKPIFLMTATLRNTYRTSYQPKLMFVNVERATVNGSVDGINFTMDDKSKNESDSPTQGSSYLLRLELKEGEYIIRGLRSQGRSFPMIGYYFTPIHAKLKSSGPGVYYLGHVEATIRERKENEFKAGPSVPLIDQAVIGASGGTFDIEITDKWESDQQEFLNKFPALKTVTVQKSILPAFDRAQAQKWWEVN